MSLLGESLLKDGTTKSGRAPFGGYPTILWMEEIHAPVEKVVNNPVLRLSTKQAGAGFLPSTVELDQSTERQL